MQLCHNCPNRCTVNRNYEIGYCGVGNKIRLARAGLHFGEEPCISGTKGSGTVFFSGCSLKCVMCQNYDISHNCFGKDVSDGEFIDIVKQLEHSGAHNINLVTPTHYYSNLRRIFNTYRPQIPIVYNSSGYESLENITEDIFDVYLFDLKFFSKEKSSRYSGAENYFEIASKVIEKTTEMVGTPQFDENGIIKRGVIVRHLILPSSTNDSIEIIKWLNSNAPDIVFSLMSQYVPMYKANEFPEINRNITRREYDKVLSHCYNANFSQIYIQELSSATKDYIPQFDLTGI